MHSQRGMAATRHQHTTATLLGCSRPASAGVHRAQQPHAHGGGVCRGDLCGAQQSLEELHDGHQRLERDSVARRRQPVVAG